MEGTNQSFKKEYTGRTRLSFPNLFTKLKDLVKAWARTNMDEIFDPEKISPKVLTQAEMILKKCHRNDKGKNLLMSKKIKSTHRTIIKKDFGVVRGHVVETNLVPLKEELFSMTQKDFGIKGQAIHKRRNNISYDAYDEFKVDFYEVAFLETFFETEDKRGNVLFACSCKYEKLKSGCKGKTCVHVGIAAIEAGLVTIGDKRRISNSLPTKGAAKKNRKQQS